MAKWFCPVCGYIHDGDSAPERCPRCNVPGSMFRKTEEGASLLFIPDYEIGMIDAAVCGVLMPCRR